MAQASDPADAGAIRERAMRLLARREHAPAELARKLGQRGFERDAVQAVLDELIDDNLLSAQRYAQALVRTRAAAGHGPLRVARDLAAQGIDDGLIDQALADESPDWYALALAERRKRFGLAVPADFPARARQMRFLQRRGFDMEQISAAMDATES